MLMEEKEHSQDNDLRDFVSETIRQVREGKGDHFVSGGEISFEIAVAKTTTKSGKAGVAVLEVVKAGGHLEQQNENTSKIAFKVILNEPDDSVGPVITGLSDDNPY